MSRIGKKPLSIPAGVTFQIDGNVITVKGPKGEMSQAFEPEYVSITQDDGTVTVNRNDDTKPARSRHGLYRSLIQNLFVGVTDGFAKTLEIRGVGYRAALQGTTLVLNLGYSHPINYELPQGIEVKFNEKENNVFTVSGIDKQQVGQVAAEIRSFRKPEPYKGKGIRYQDEYVARKAGKSVKA